MQACDIIPASIITPLRRKTGLRIGTADHKDVLAAIHARMEKCGIRDIGAYLRRLAGQFFRRCLKKEFVHVH